MKLTPPPSTDYLVGRGVVPPGAELQRRGARGGVSGTVLAVRGPGLALVVKQALPQLRVAEEWKAPARRTDTEAAALRLAARLIPGRVPPVVDSDAASTSSCCSTHRPAGATGRPSCSRAARTRPRAAGPATRSAACTPRRAGDAEVAAAFDDYEAFALLRLAPYYGTAMRAAPPPRRGDRAARAGAARRRAAASCTATTRRRTSCSAATAPGSSTPRSLTSATRSSIWRSSWSSRCSRRCSGRELSAACGAIVEGFLRGYARRAPALLPAPRAVAAHTGAMLLARTDGRSPATFLDARGVRRAREIGERLLLDPAAPRPGAASSLAARERPFASSACWPSRRSTRAGRPPWPASSRSPAARRPARRCPRAHRRAATRRTSGATAAIATAGAARSPRWPRSTARSRPRCGGATPPTRPPSTPRLRELDGTPCSAGWAPTPSWRLPWPARSRPPRPRARRSGGCSPPTQRPLLPRPMVNVLSGGAHAGRAVDVQDVLVIPLAATTFARGDRARGAGARRCRSGAPRARPRHGPRGRRGRSRGAAGHQRGGARDRDPRASSAPASRPRSRWTSPRRS